MNDRTVNGKLGNARNLKSEVSLRLNVKYYDNDNNIPSVISHVGYWEGGIYTTSPLPYEGKKVVSNRM